MMELNLNPEEIAEKLQSKYGLTKEEAKRI